MRSITLFLGFGLLVGGSAFAQGDPLADTLEGLYVGPPVLYGALTLFPLDNPFLSDRSAYRTIEELLAEGTLRLAETVPQRQNILLLQTGTARDQLGSTLGGGGSVFAQMGGGLGGGSQGRGFGRSFLLPEGGGEGGSTPFLPGGPRIVQGPAASEGSLLAPGTEVLPPKEAGYGGRLVSAAEVDQALHTTGLAIPVFCLEEKRFAGFSSRFMPTFTLAPQAVRRAMLGPLTQDTQERVWQAVLEELRQAGTPSRTRALAAIYEPPAFRAAVQEAITDLSRQPVWNDHTVGLAAAVNGRLLALDVYVNPDLFRRMAPRLIAAHAVEAIRATPAPPPPTSAVYALLKALASARRELQPALALGQDYVLRSPTVVGEALIYQGTLIHASGFPVR